jgi:perosamine synthetase
MLLLDDEKLYERCSFLRDHGRKPGGPMYFNFEVTFKYMPFNVQAALGYAQFQRIQELVDKKRWIYQSYKENLADVPGIQLNDERDGVYNGVWITGVVFAPELGITKQSAMETLGKMGVPSRPFFYPLSSLPAYAGSEKVYRPRNPVAYDVSARGINLPGALNLTADQIDFVSEGVRKLVAGQSSLKRAA